MTRLGIGALLVWLAVAPVRTQIGTGAIVSYRVDVFDIAADPLGTGKPLVTMTLAAGAAVCNLAPLVPVTTLTQVNPQAVYWLDPLNAGKICKLSTPLLTTLPTLAVSNYILTVTLVDDLGRLGPPSPVSLPFNNTAPRGVTGVVAR